MKKIIYISIYSLILVYSSSIYAIDTNAIRYLPLAVGNIYVYNWIYNGPPGNGGISRSYIFKDTIVNSKRYFYCNFPTLQLNPQFIRLDSATGNIFGYNPAAGCTNHPYEVLLDSLCSRKFDTSTFCNLEKRICTDTGFITLFGMQLSRKNFFPYMALTASSRFYAKNIGFYNLTEGDPWVTIYSLKGCVLNGIVYGDTTMVGLEPISAKIPEQFSLSQNYPNPFNPKTVINFQLPMSGNVKLIIYDVLGREVAILVNQQLKPGTYEVEWDGTNYPSGVYFYKLQTESFTRTRRMVLVK